MAKVCCAEGCKNSQRKPHLLQAKSHIRELRWHRLPKGKSAKTSKKRKQWVDLIKKGKKNFKPSDETFVCSNHFVDGEPTQSNPCPTLFLRSATSAERKPPRERQPLIEVKADIEIVPIDSRPMPICSSQSISIRSALNFGQFTREADVRFYTGLSGTTHFRALFRHLEQKAARLRYWRGPKITSLESMENDIMTGRRGPKRNMDIQQEFSMSLMKLRLVLFKMDLAFRFQVSDSVVSETLLTWFKFLGRELACLIIWPSRGQTNITMPECFKRHFNKVRVIIDCTEVFIETPISLLAQKQTWSEYKHHCTIKFLIRITPTGAISWVSPVYSGRVSDVTIVRDSGFLELLDPFDQVMADRGFKIKTDLAAKQCTLAKGIQMRANDAQTTSRIANVRIQVERVIKRFKEFSIFSSSDLPVQLAPVYKEMIIICAALTNLKERIF